MAEETALVSLVGLDMVQVYTKNGIDKLLDEIEKVAKSFVMDVETTNGRVGIKSIARKVVRAKIFLDDAGKDIVLEWKKKAGVIDAERRKVRDRLDALKEEVRQPLTEWEAAEAAKEEAIRLEEEKRIQAEQMAETIRIAKIEAELNAMKKKERLRIEAEEAERKEQERKDYEERIQKEAAERVAKEAEDRKASNAKHRATVNKEAIQSLIELGITEDIAAAVVDVILKGLVKNIYIKY